MTTTTSHLPSGRPNSQTSSLDSPCSSPYLQAAPSSTASIVPSIISQTSELASAPLRRRLLVIYIHGFYGNDKSFWSFPAHVHVPLKTLLCETHFVHSKIYPRYKTYKAIEVGRDAFCQWLRPHTGDNTDVVLVGHSMGGILAAEVVLKTTPGPYGTSALENRILGIVALDTPFLGMHHGIIVSGLSSLFSDAPPTPEPFGEPDTEPSSPHRCNTSIFNPSFANDTRLKTRPFKESLAHFARKHKPHGLLQAAKTHVWDHLQYCGCLLDYPSLAARYARLRALEDVDPLQASLLGRRRVRFVNYYTTCDGRQTTPKTPRASRSGPGRDFVDRQLIIEQDDSIPGPILQAGENSPLSLSPTVSAPSTLSEDSRAADPLPPIPTMPIPPIRLSPNDLDALDKPARKAVKKKQSAERRAHKDAFKAYLRSSKAHAKALKKQRKEAAPALQQDTLVEPTVTSSNDGSLTTLAAATASDLSSSLRGAGVPENKTHQRSQKERRFCVLPTAARNDKTWIKVGMHGVDEVGAHCGLFFPGAHYEALVGDVAIKISEWVQEDMTRREVLRLREAGEGV